MGGKSGVSVVEKLAARGLLSDAERIALEHAVTRSELLGRKRTKQVSAARRKLYEHLRELGMSYPEIGWLLDRNHTTVMSGCRPPRKV